MQKQNLQTQAERLMELKLAAEEATRAFKDFQQLFVLEMDVLEEQSLEFADEDYNYKLKVVRGERTNIDPVSLKKALGARMWNTLTERKLDLKKVERAISKGDIDPVIVSQSTTYVNSSPYVRITDSKRID